MFNIHSHARNLRSRHLYNARSVQEGERMRMRKKREGSEINLREEKTEVNLGKGQKKKRSSALRQL